MKNTFFPALSVFALLAACAGTGPRAFRAPSSVPEAAFPSVELASRIEGGSMKFRAFHDGDQISALGFLELKFKKCEAKAGPRGEPGIEDGNSFVDCEADVSSDAMRAPIHAYLSGDKREFKIRFASADRKHNLTAEIHLLWQDHSWTGDGQVTGWLARDAGPGLSAPLPLHESLSF